MLMQPIAPAPPVAARPYGTRAPAEPAGWSPGLVSPDRSTRADGLLRGGLDAWLGRAELARGVPLTTTQVQLLTPFLAQHAGLPAHVVRADLEQVRVHVGGLASGAGNVATTIGHHVYVSDAAWATRLLSWGSRRWLVHELAHTMQWRRVVPPAAGTAARDRAFLERYLAGLVHHEGRPSEGALLAGLREWLRHPSPGAGSIGDAIHDAHHMEREASAIAAAFG